jgi:predicted nucleotidyltransferase
MTPATEEKRDQFKRFIEEVLAPEPAVKGVVGIGSIATGRMRPDSDIDALIFLDPFDYHIVPAEAIWDPETDTFHSIFTENTRLHEQGLQLDFLRLKWRQWTELAIEWPEPRKAELSQGWIAFDRSGRLPDIIATHTAYDYETRLKRLDEAIIWLDQHLNWSKAAATWEALGPLVAHDRLHAAFHYLVDALFAYNSVWRPWRNREMDSLLRLPWLPDNFAERALVADNSPNLEFAGYEARIEAMHSLFDDLLQQVVANGDYTHVPIDQAFIRQSEEPGRAWNMEEWNKFRTIRQMSREGEA